MKLKKIFLFILMIFLLQSIAYAKIRLTVGIVHNKGVDKGLVLVSELYAIEDIEGDKNLSLKMKDDLKIELWAQFVDDLDTYGPSSMVEVKGNIYNRFGKLIKSYFDPPVLIKLEEEKTLFYKDEEMGQLIEITIRPDVK